jgi:hypothetical protein
VLLSRQPQDLRLPPDNNVVAHLAVPFPVDELIALVRKHARSSRGRGGARHGERRADEPT